MRLMHYISIYCLIVLVTACDFAPKAPLKANALTGTHAIIKRDNTEIVLKIVDVNGKLVTKELFINDQIRSSQTDYRGLFRLSGQEYDRDGQVFNYEIDMDTQDIEKFFPLKVGKKATLRGKARVIEANNSFSVWLNAQVVSEQVLSIGDRNHDVFVINILEEFESSEGVRSRTETIYYAPEVSMVLKRVSYANGQEVYWRVTSLELPGDNPARPSRLQQRRSGTVMI
ncbi:hypothetical protein [Kordiimonas sp. SCSIO 12610]|uniref:hypothetical protein n=1 Tax=Kordiimonas sp. SCSIO 12610 TaxID=2829597 RepID=UPI00210A1F49|nr:hypothetical protein [Kordiimonas sp. SCSIO 12610]UTW55295.1 hypothetical protein KFF44_16045 [Kordiimonas sp. SCSIO 12610]